MEFSAVKGQFLAAIESAYRKVRNVNASTVPEDFKKATKSYHEWLIQQGVRGSEWWRNLSYSSEGLQKLENDIKYQGGYYRELLGRRTGVDALLIGGISLAELASAEHLPDAILNAYQAAYPNLAQTISFQDRLQSLDDTAIQGFVSGIKGKLFEMQYVDYLNGDILPEGYVASIAESATQPGWDIAIQGPNGEIAAVLQAKATDSVAYVEAALEKYPAIDVVSTSEVYSELALSAVGDRVIDGGIANDSLTAFVEDELTDATLGVDFVPPVLALAFIAFTSYKDQSLTLYEKATSFGDRSGQMYISYLIGGSIAAVTNTWWLGPACAVTSRVLGGIGIKKLAMMQELGRTYRENVKAIERLEKSVGVTQ